MHRNTLLFTLLLAIVAALLIGFNVGRKFQTPPSSPTPTPTPTRAAALETFTSETCGITLQYPGNLNKLDGASGSAVFTDPANEKNSIVVACQDDIPRLPLAADKIETVSLLSASGSATISARLYRNATAKDGAPFDELIFTHPKLGVDVFIAGFGATFEDVLLSLRIL